MLVVGRYVVAALSWGVTLIVVRELSVSDFGRYQLIFSLLAIVGFIADLRLSRIVLRDVMDAEGDDAGAIIGSYLGMRLVIGAVSYVGAMAWVLIGGYPALRRDRDRGRGAQPHHPVRRVRADPAVRGAALAARRRHREHPRSGRADHRHGGHRDLRDRVDPVVLVVDGRQCTRADALDRRRDGSHREGAHQGRVAPLVGVVEGSRTARTWCRARHRLLPDRHRDAVAARHVPRGRPVQRRLQVLGPARRGPARGRHPGAHDDGGGVARATRRHSAAPSGTRSSS